LKSRGERDVTDPQIAVVQESARFFESRACDVIDKVRSGYLLEFFAEIIRVNIDYSRHPVEGKFFTRMFLDKPARFPNFHRFRPDAAELFRLIHVRATFLITPSRVDHARSTAASLLLAISHLILAQGRNGWFSDGQLLQRKSQGTWSAKIGGALLNR